MSLSESFRSPCFAIWAFIAIACECCISCELWSSEIRFLLFNMNNYIAIICKRKADAALFLCQTSKSSATFASFGTGVARTCLLSPAQSAKWQIHSTELLLMYYSYDNDVDWDYVLQSTKMDLLLPTVVRVDSRVLPGRLLHAWIPGSPTVAIRRHIPEISLSVRIDGSVVWWGTRCAQSRSPP